MTFNLCRRYVIKDVVKSYENYGTNLGHKGYLISKVRSCYEAKMSITNLNPWSRIRRLTCHLVPSAILLKELENWIYLFLGKSPATD